MSESERAMSDNITQLLKALPDNPSGRRLKAQHLLWQAVQETASTIGSSEAAAEAKRIGRFLGFVEKMNRGPKSGQAPQTEEPASAPETKNAAKPDPATASKPPAGFSTGNATSKSKA